ncbi:hypothetical protein ACFPYM_15390 [Methylobacterium hispanicum]|nr:MULTISPECIES: hypothetical protein [Methylobacterium]
MTSAQPRAIIVAGMHRSGTSALTRVLNLLGVELPERLVPGFSGNELGHWEPEEVVAIHDALLHAADSDVNDPVGFDPAWIESSESAPGRERIRAFLQNTFSRSPSVVIKDPRICLFLPLWQDEMRKMGLQDLYIHPYRTPDEVAASLTRRQTQVFPESVWPSERGGLLWLRYIKEAERATRNHPRAFLSFDGLLADWRGTIARVSAQIGMDFSYGEASATAVDAFLDHSHKHETIIDGRVDLPELDRYVEDLRRLEREPAWGGHGFSDVGALNGIRERYLNKYVMALERKNNQLALDKKIPSPVDLSVGTHGRFEFKNLLHGLNVGIEDGATKPSAERITRALAEALRRTGHTLQVLQQQSAQAKSEESAALAAQIASHGANADALEAARSEIQDISSRLTETRAAADEAALNFSEAQRELTQVRAALRKAETELEQVSSRAECELRELARHSEQMQAETLNRSEKDNRLWQYRLKLEQAARAQSEGRLVRLRRSPLAALAMIAGSLTQSAKVKIWSREHCDRRLLVQSSGLFDAAWYCSYNSDLKGYEMDPIDHFVAYGSRELRSPGPRFCAIQYAEAYADVVEAPQEPLFHFLKYGNREGRKIFPVRSLSPSSER